MTISYVGPMSEEDYLAVVERIQQAMAIEPFRPPLIDVIKLLADWRHLTNENQRLLSDNAELSDECDRWERKQEQSWVEISDLRAQLAASQT